MEPKPPQFSQEEIDNRFDYHAPDAQKAVTHENVRASFKVLATYLNGTLPDGRDKATCLTNLEQAMFSANAAIARNP